MRGLTADEARVLSLSLPGGHTTQIDESDAQVAETLVKRGLLTVEHRRRRTYWHTNGLGVLALRLSAAAAEATK